MQRATLFFVFISSFFLLSGQKSYPSVELDFQFTQDEKIVFRAICSPISWSSRVEVKLLKAQGIRVYLIKAGSRKSLEHIYDGKKLELLFTELPHPLAKLEIHYYLERVDLEENSAWSYLEEGFIFNNVKEDMLKSEAGFVFPCFNNERHNWRLDLIVPATWLVYTPLQEEFRVDLTEQIARYYASEQADKPGALLLEARAPIKRKELKRIGLIKEVVVLKEVIPTENIRIANFKLENKALLAFIEKRKAKPWREEEFKELLSKPKTSAGMYLKHEMMPAHLKSKEDFYLEQKVLLNSAESNQQASNWQEEFYLQSLGVNYLDTFLQKRFNDSLEIDSHSLSNYLNRYLATRNLKLSDTTRLLDSSLTEEIKRHLSSAKAAYKAKGKVMVNLKYQYYYKRKVMELCFSQADSNLFGDLDFSALAMSSSDSTQANFNIKFNLKDTISWTLKGAPRSIYITVLPRPWNLFWLKEHRPQNYYLYDFSVSKDPVLKRKALIALLETRQANLLATVMGIAIDSGDLALQLLALGKAEKLNSIGKQKLAQSIKALAEEATDVKLKQKAAEAYKFMSP
ncbi:MAG: hypothetical protein ACJAZH_000688 [Roseivirga sp.]|jgi:hypothetical protein